MNESGRLERVLDALLFHVLFGDLAKFAIDESKECVGRLPVAGIPIAENPRNFAWAVGHDRNYNPRKVFLKFVEPVFLDLTLIVVEMTLTRTGIRVSDMMFLQRSEAE